LQKQLIKSEEKKLQDLLKFSEWNIMQKESNLARQKSMQKTIVYNLIKNDLISRKNIEKFQKLNQEKEKLEFREYFDKHLDIENKEFIEESQKKLRVSKVLNEFYKIQTNLKKERIKQEKLIDLNICEKYKEIESKNEQNRKFVFYGFYRNVDKIVF